jgi:peptidoglycan/LPS O-acetylase OafA/YrhL
VLLYAGFFLLWRYSPAPLLLSALLIAVSLWVFPAQYKISLGVFGFFCGGLGYIAADWLLRCFDVRWVAAGLVLACGAGWWWCGGDAAQSPLVRFAVLFPLTIVAVAACHPWLQSLARRVSWLGDISFAAYLLHFPLQIVAALLADKFLPGRAVFYQPWSLLLFFAVLIGSSLLCHYGFERPVQRWIRRRTVGHNKVAAMAR